MSDSSIKRATWLELLYDVAFVALIAQLTYLAADHIYSVQGMLHVFIVGYTIFLTWWSTTVNRNLQIHETVNDKLLIQIQLIGGFLMSITMPGVFEGSYTGYFAALAVVRLLQVAMVLRLYRIHPELKPVTKNVVKGVAIAALLWLTAGFVIDPFHYVVALAALAVDVFTPLTKGKGNTVRFLNVHHMQERLGLFFMLVLGESLLVVALANTTLSIDIARPLFLLCGVVTIIALWWIYFEYMERCAQQRRPKNFFIYLHAHGFLFGSVVLLATAFKNFLKHGVPSQADLLIYFSAVGGILITIIAIRAALRGSTSVPEVYKTLIAVGMFGVAYLVSSVYESAGEYVVLLVTGALVVTAWYDWHLGKHAAH